MPPLAEEWARCGRHYLIKRKWLDHFSYLRLKKIKRGPRISLLAIFLFPDVSQTSQENWATRFDDKHRQERIREAVSVGQGSKHQDVVAHIGARFVVQAEFTRRSSPNLQSHRHGTDRCGGTPKVIRRIVGHHRATADRK